MKAIFIFGLTVEDWRVLTAGCQTPQEFIKRFGDFSKKLPKDPLILNSNWDHENWTQNNLLTAEAHNHNLESKYDFQQRVDKYLTEGVYYGKILSSIKN